MLLANRVRKSLLLMIPRLMKSAVKIDRTLDRRLKGEPIAYILGEKNFGRCH